MQTIYEWIDFIRTPETTKLKYKPEQLRIDRRIVEAVAREDINPYGFHDIEIKQRILEEIGIRHLRVGSDNSVEPFEVISRCEPERINEVFRDKYNRATERLLEFDNGLRVLQIPVEGNDPKSQSIPVSLGPEYIEGRLFL